MTAIPEVAAHRSSFYARHAKRWIDAALAALALVVLAPLLAAIAVAIKLDSRGTVLYRQERIGLRGRAFLLTKFRSMEPGAEHKGAGVRVERADPRVTRVGRVLRRLSLDELPQLFDVLRGDMSVVGPRPALRYQVELYDATQLGRLAVRPGLTGWAQVRGRNRIDWARRIELDLEYVARLSAATDLQVVLRTLPVVLRGSDVIATSDYWAEKAKERAAARPRDGGPAS